MSVFMLSYLVNTNEMKTFFDLRYNYDVFGLFLNSLKRYQKYELHVPDKN